MRKILGLDIGTNSIGWAFVLEDPEGIKETMINKLGVRIIPMGTEQQEFESGNAITKNADRRTKRSIRRNNHRYKLRKRLLITKLSEMGMFPFSEYGNRLKEEIESKTNTNSFVFDLRSKGLSEKLTLKEIGRIFYHMNQKRGYKSNRKTNEQETESDDDSYLGRIEALDDYLKNNNLTVGQYFSEQFEKNPYSKVKENIFLRARFIEEFDKIWNKQKEYYPDTLNDLNYNSIRDEIIYYQRKLKSQKHLVSDCQFEKGHKAAPKSSPIFQVYKIWQMINNLEIKHKTGKNINISLDQKEILFAELDNSKTINASSILKKLNISPRDEYEVNYEKLEGNHTKSEFLKAFKEADIEKSELLLFNSLDNNFDKSNYYQLWHLLYATEEINDIINTLQRKFGFTNEQAKIISKLSFKSDHGSLSTRAMRKLLPFLMQGFQYSDACQKVKEIGNGKNNQYDHSESLKPISNVDVKTGEILFPELSLLHPNSLRNPVVEKVVNQVINLVNSIIHSSDFGRPDEIRVELARELKMNIKNRKEMFKKNIEKNKDNLRVEKILKDELGFRNVNRNDIQKYKLWEETDGISLYTGKKIEVAKLFDTSLYDIEHIIPKSRLFDDSFNNKTICETAINREKSDLTAFDFMKSKAEDEFNDYIERINQNKKLSRRKRNYLLMPENKIPLDFVERQLKETQYINKAVIKVLKYAASKVTSTTGSITDFLRYNWGLNTVLEQLNYKTYKELGMTSEIINNGQKKEVIKDWSKRLDHRHHAIDALVVALTKLSHINRLNRLNQFVKNQEALKEKARKIEPPILNITNKTMSAVDELLISFKKNNKVITSKKNNIEKYGIIQKTFVPRGPLHKETIYGKIKKVININVKKAFENIENIADGTIKNRIRERINASNGDIKKAVKSIRENPIIVNGKELITIPVFETTFAIRKQLNGDFKQVDKIIDPIIKNLVQERLIEHKNNPKEAFKDLDNNPIWQNREKGIKIKSVRIYENASDLQPLHENEKGEPIDFVYTRNNHHIAIYENEDGSLSEEVVSLWDAVERKLNGLPVINKTPIDGRKFLTSLEINEMFVMNLNPDEIDFFDKKNYPQISKNLYRVQKLSSKYYSFRHHLDTNLDKEYFPFYIRIQSFGEGKTGWKTFNPIKVRIDNLNRIVKIGD